MRKRNFDSQKYSQYSILGYINVFEPFMFHTRICLMRFSDFLISYINKKIFV